MDLSKAADQGVAVLRARLEAEPPPGVSAEAVSGFFGRHGAALSNELRRLLEVALQVPAPLEGIGSSSSQAQEVYDYRMTFTGIFGRNRKVKDESVKLLRHVPRSEPKTIEELKPMMRDALEEHRVRADATVVVREYPVEITPDGFEKHIVGSVRVLFRGSAKDIL